jgi:DNA (cytosine-5)-methyltransferase 1
LGFDAKWGVVSAADIGANHQRERIWIRAEQRNILSHTEHNGFGWGQQWSEGTQEKDVADTKSCGSRRITREFQAQNERKTSERQKEWVWQSDNASEMADSNEYGTQGQSSDTGKPSEWINSSGIAGRNQDVTDSMQSGLQGGGKVWQTNNEIWQNAELWRTAAKRSWWTAEPNVGRVADGLAGRVDRLKAIGNGQVPLCAATAWELLK